MSLKENKLWMASLVICSLTWPSLVQAFFCFSVGAGAGAGGKHRDRHYSGPPPPMAFGAVGYPLFSYSPVPQRLEPQALVPVAPVSSSELSPEAGLAGTDSRPVRQQIFE